MCVHDNYALKKVPQKSETSVEAKGLIGFTRISMFLSVQNVIIAENEIIIIVTGTN